MLREVIIVSAIVALASEASANYWQQCEPLSTKVDSVKLDGCDPDHSTAERCALAVESTYNVSIDYIQSKPIKVPRFSQGYYLDANHEFVGCAFGLECPGKVGQVQRIKSAIDFGYSAKGSRQATYRYTIRENGTSIDKVDHLCIDFSVFLIPPKQEAVAKSNSNLISWSEFKQQFGKVYASQQEEARRFAIFMANKQLVQRQNASFNFTLALNHLADMTPEEYTHPREVSMLKDPLDMISVEDLGQILGSASDDPLPRDFDWRQHKNRVSDVKNEGTNCSASWAFATIGLLEGQELSQNMASLVPLSEQVILDCSGFNRACDGGWPASVLKDLAEGRGAAIADTDYPYKAIEEACRLDESKYQPMNKVGGYKLLPARDEQTLKKTLVTYGPVIVSIHATPKFGLYESGVFEDDTCTRDMSNRDLLLVGYGNDQKEGDYWIIKNSMGAEWGEEGYMRIKAGENMCGIADFGTIATF